MDRKNREVKEIKTGQGEDQGAGRRTGCGFERCSVKKSGGKGSGG